MAKNSGEICPICDNRLHNSELFGDMYKISCVSCGQFMITGTAKSTVKNSPAIQDKHWILSGVLRSSYEKGTVLTITDNIEGLLASAAIPDGPVERMDLIVMHIYSNSDRAGFFIKLSKEDYPLAFARDRREFRYLIDQLLTQGLIEEDDPERHFNHFRLSLDGWKRVRELKQHVIDSSQAFVAMWFDAEMDPAWEEGFEPALTETGYRPFRVDLDEHNGKIDDHIIASIRKSGLLVADFTGDRGGVYFEAGFALGLGTQVIWTCRADQIKELHFDTRQYNHIKWEKPDDLKKSLVARIEATVLTRTSTHST